MEANLEKIKEASAVVKEYAEEALKISKSVISKNTLATRIISVVETFLVEKKRIIYGGAAINILLPKSLKFYDPEVDLPDYDFLTPDALEDCAILMEKYKIAGFKDVETRLGIHEGTYKIFVNYRAAADITELPKDIYNKLHKKARVRAGLVCAPPDWLRMACYLELSRPLGDVEIRWAKVFYRLQLLNKIYPLKVSACVSAEEEKTRFPPKKRRLLHAIILQVLEDTRTLFAGAMVEGIYKELEVHTEKTENVLGASLIKYDPRYILTTETLDETTDYLAGELKARFPVANISIKMFDAVGELMPERREVFYDTRRIATIFPTVACHAFLSLNIHIPYDQGYTVRVASVDTSITLLYSMWYSGLQNTVGRRILCVIQALIDIEAHMRLNSPRESKISLFPFTCLGHQPSLPELKKAHRERVIAKKEKVRKYLDSILIKNSKKTRKNSQNKVIEKA